MGRQGRGEGVGGEKKDHRKKKKKKEGRG